MVLLLCFIIIAIVRYLRLLHTKEKHRARFAFSSADSYWKETPQMQVICRIGCPLERIIMQVHSECGCCKHDVQQNIRILKSPTCETYERPCRCETCGSANTFKVYMLKHCGNLHYRCQMCEKSYALAVHLFIQTYTYSYWWEMSQLREPSSCIWATSWENHFMQYANNKGAVQPAHLRSLISPIVVRCLDSIIPLVSISKLSSLYLASVDAQAGLCLTWLQTPNTGFLVTRLICWHTVEIKKLGWSTKTTTKWPVSPVEI